MIKTLEQGNNLTKTVEFPPNSLTRNYSGSKNERPNTACG